MFAVFCFCYRYHWRSCTRAHDIARTRTRKKVWLVCVRQNAAYSAFARTQRQSAFRRQQIKPNVVVCATTFHFVSLFVTTADRLLLLHAHKTAPVSTKEFVFCFSVILRALLAHKTVVIIVIIVIFITAAIWPRNASGWFFFVLLSVVVVWFSWRAPRHSRAHNKPRSNRIQRWKKSHHNFLWY